MTMATPTEQARKIWDWIEKEEEYPLMFVDSADYEAVVLKCADWLYKNLNDSNHLLYYRSKWRNLYKLFSNTIDGDFVLEMLIYSEVPKVLRHILIHSKDSQKECDARISATIQEVLNYLDDIKTAFIRAALNDYTRPICTADWVVTRNDICNIKTDELKDLDVYLYFGVCIGNLPAASTDADRESKPQQAEANTPIVGAKVGAVISDDTANINKPKLAQPKSAGRKVQSFDECLSPTNQNEHRQILHSFIDGKKGKNVVLIIKSAIELGWLTKPTYKTLCREFGEIGNYAGYKLHWNSYSTDDETTRGEIKGMKAALRAEEAN